MNKKEELDLMEIKLGVLQEKIKKEEGKRKRFTQKDIKDIERVICSISEDLSSLLSDDLIAKETKEKLMYETQKQIVKLGKVIDSLRVTVRISKEVFDN